LPVARYLKKGGDFLMSYFRIKFLILIGVLLVGLLVMTACGGSKPTPAGGGGEQKEQLKTYEFSLAHMWPATHVVETVVAQGWAKAVEEATNGQVKIVSYPAATLLTGPETYEGVIQGVADIGIGVYSYSRGRFPVIEAFLLPGISYNNSKAASYAAHEGLKALNPAEIQDVKYFFTFSTGPGYMVIDRPVQQMSDIRGVEIGVTSGPRVDAVQALGGTGISVPMPQFYENLQSGIIKGGVFPLEVMQGYKLSEVTGDYIIDIPFLYSQMFFSVMNKETFSSLPADLQKKVDDATQKFYAEKIPGLFDEINQKGWEYHKQQKPSVEITRLAPEEEARWLEKIDPIIANYEKSLADKKLDGAKIMKTVRDMVEKYNKQFPK
jgi:TRAP-type C4-dicarboxylate transport system substrate-binding protein